MKLLSVVGARPQFVKLAPIDRELRRRGIEHVIVHTGQHYDSALSDVFFEDLGISKPDTQLAIGSASHGRQTGAMLSAMDGVLEEVNPNWVMVYGDTNSTLAGALSAVKMHLPVAHLEAGLRSFNRRMPEEHNRIVSDHVADLLLAPTDVAMMNLRNEGLQQRSRLVGDVMVDVLFENRDKVLRDGVKAPEGVSPGGYLVATIHRADNTDDPRVLERVLEHLSRLELPVLLFAHPRLVAKAEQSGLQLQRGSLQVRPPLPYPELVAAVLSSAGVVTDSGGLQKEAFLLRKRCFTLRSETEWVETVSLGWNQIVRDPADLATAIAELQPADVTSMPYGDGNAASKVVDALVADAR